jgi:acetoin utilization protein AcuB
MEFPTSCQDDRAPVHHERPIGAGEFPPHCEIVPTHLVFIRANLVGALRSPLAPSLPIHLWLQVVANEGNVNLEQERAMRVNDVMSTNVLTVDLREPLDRARSAMDRRHVHHLVVVDGSRVVGLVTAELLAWGEAQGIARVEDVMFRHVVSGNPDLTIREAANLLRGRTVGALPIFERERLVGIVTISDLLDLLGRGAERPVPSSRRWTLRDRGKKPLSRTAGARAK